MIPDWMWFLEPSGGPVQPGFWGFVDGIKRRPVVAHPVGAALVVWVFALAWPPLAGLAAALLAESVNQFYKAKRGVYGAHLWLNVIWRLILAAIGGGLVVVLR